MSGVPRHEETKIMQFVLGLIRDDVVISIENMNQNQEAFGDRG